MPDGIEWKNRDLVRFKGEDITTAIIMPFERDHHLTSLFSTRVARRGPDASCSHALRSLLQPCYSILWVQVRISTSPQLNVNLEVSHNGKLLIEWYRPQTVGRYQPIRALNMYYPVSGVQWVFNEHVWDLWLVSGVMTPSSPSPVDLSRIASLYFSGPL